MYATVVCLSVCLSVTSLFYGNGKTDRAGFLADLAYTVF